MKYMNIGNPNKFFLKMKHIIITALFLLNVLISFGQEEKLYSKIYVRADRAVSKFSVADSGNIRIWYTLNAFGKVNKADSCDDLQALEIGENISKYYSSVVFKADSTSEIVNKGRKETTLRVGIKGTPAWSEYFKDFKTGVFTEYARMPWNVPNYYYFESIPVQDWALIEDTLSIAGYLCQKATCRFRGRNYTAWFTPDIPISNGPWKFGGLPGLILKVYDTDREFVFECTGIETKKFPVKKFDYSKYRETKRNNVLKLLNDIDEDYIKVMGGTITSHTGPYPPGKSPNKPPFNTMLIERE
jgi:GLPGLI family protein